MNRTWAPQRREYFENLVREIWHAIFDMAEMIGETYHLDVSPFTESVAYALLRYLHRGIEITSRPFNLSSLQQFILLYANLNAYRERAFRFLRGTEISIGRTPELDRQYMSVLRMRPPTLSRRSRSRRRALRPLIDRRSPTRALSRSPSSP